MDIAFLNELRYWIQSVLVPCIVIVGVLGNLVTVLVLTRRRMRCSTNVYLTALAIADLIYLLFVFVLSLEHNPYMHHIKYELYWRLYGLSHWFADATSYTSIWLAVSFTIERYIAVCHPIRGKALCTESRAKKVISCVVIFSFLSTATTPFEYQLTQTSTATALSDSHNVSVVYTNSTNITNIENCTLEITNLTNACESEEFYLYADLSALGNNSTYRAIFYWSTSIVFVILPLILLATFNCFLVAAVHRSSKQRGKMTNSKLEKKQTQENKITRILIAVVLLFLICQTPMAGLLMYSSWITPETPEEANVLRALGNIFNLLVTLNAALNFLLYCALSDKYRRTFKALFLREKPVQQSTIRTMNTLRDNSHRPLSAVNSFKSGNVNDTRANKE